MARKGGRGGAGGGRRAVDAAESTSSRAQRRFGNDDISDDEIDSFHNQRDKILLDGENDADDVDPYDALGAGGRSILNVDEAMSDDEDDEDMEGEDDEDDADDIDDYDDNELHGASNAVRKPAGKTSSYAAEESDDSDDEDGAGSDAEEDEDGAAGWGPNKRAYYSTNDLDDLESDSEMDEDEKRELELREVRKLQTKARQGMTDDDFGLADDSAVRDISAAAREQRRKDLDAGSLSSQAAPKNATPAPLQAQLAPAELLAKVQRQTPETLALVGEYADVVDDLQKAQLRMQVALAKDPNHPHMGLLHLHHHTLMTYVAMLTFYFYRRASGSSTSTTSKPTDEEIVQRLAKLKQGLTALEDFGLGVDEDGDDDHDHEDEVEGDEDEDDGDEEDEEENLRNERISFLFKPPGINGSSSDDEDEGVSLGSLEEDELMALEAEEKENQSAKASTSKPKKSALEKKATASAQAPNGKAAKNGDKSAKAEKKKKAKQVAPLANVAAMVDADTMDDEEPQTKRRKRAGPSAQRDGADFDVYGEPTSLGAADLADKEARRRSLKFYTGQIDARDGRAGKNAAMQGDVDIPYRDRERSRQAVANANAAKTAKAEGRTLGRGAALDNDDFGEDDMQAYRDVMGKDMGDVGGSSNNGRGAQSGSNDNDDDAGYYDLITSGRKAERQARKADYDEARAAERVAPDDAMLDEGEHRGINRQIEKNKGLMAGRRPKTVRNPRVKKRKRYEKAQKKLSSQGPVYKGGQAALQGGYGGETSGISSNVVKSRKFN